MSEPNLKVIANNMRKDIIKMLAEAKSGHPGGSLSIVELLVAIYFNKANIDPNSPKCENRDRFVLSKGHAAPALYAVMAQKGFFSSEDLLQIRKKGSNFQGHPDMHKIPGIDMSTGSLGQGVSVAVGMAIAGKLSPQPYNVFTILGDGELQEGQVWEASMAASNYKLDNLTVIVDNNGLQSDGTNDQVMSLGDISEKFRAFGFETFKVDGHNIDEITEALNASSNNKPKCIIAQTVKGKGISFMENQVGWHGKAPAGEEIQLALNELEEVSIG